jgi:2-C-methyl-D-erythritol 2,4-cyclodiphosphate synthase
LCYTSGIRIGTALDVHGFSDNGVLKLGLQNFPDYHQLDGDSDADVVAHALSDAFLLAAGLPDLGGLIGVGEKEWKGASGRRILERVLQEVKSAGFVPESASVQIVARRPRLLSVLPNMRNDISSVVGCQVNVSATTTDGLISDLGNGNCIMAIATVLLV